MTNLLIATGNRHKVDEIQSILGATFVCRSLADRPDAPKVAEDAGTFAGNATKKAVTIHKWLAERSPSETPLVVADDSGLEVDALNGDPGVHSARFAAMDRSGELSVNSSDRENLEKLLCLLRGVPADSRTARFRCVIALAGLPEGVRCFEGVCEGRIQMQPTGQGGFGYDPIFVPDGYHQSFAALDAEVKNRISHRAKALEQLKSSLRALNLSRRQ